MMDAASATPFPQIIFVAVVAVDDVSRFDRAAAFGRAHAQPNKPRHVAHYGEFVQLERRKSYGRFGGKRTGVSARANGECVAMPCEAMAVSVVV
jgi:hypothetical protein